MVMIYHTNPHCTIRDSARNLQLTDTDLCVGRAKFTASGAYGVIAITWLPKNDLCTEELREFEKSLDTIRSNTEKLDTIVYFLGRERYSRITMGGCSSLLYACNTCTGTHRHLCWWDFFVLKAKIIYYDDTQHKNCSLTMQLSITFHITLSTYHKQQKVVLKKVIPTAYQQNILVFYC